MQTAAFHKAKPVNPSRQTVCTLVLCLLFLAVGMSIPGNFTVTITDSVDYHVFWAKGGRNPKRNDYVRLPLFDPAVECNPCSIVKRVGCIPGDKLEEKAGFFFCNNVFLGQAVSEKYPAFQFSGTVPEGAVFLIGDQEKSYDSRYFGFKQISDIETVLWPLF